MILYFHTRQDQNCDKQTNRAVCITYKTEKSAHTTNNKNNEKKKKAVFQNLRTHFLSFANAHQRMKILKFKKTRRACYFSSLHNRVTIGNVLFCCSCQVEPHFFFLLSSSSFCLCNFIYKIVE